MILYSKSKHFHCWKNFEASSKGTNWYWYKLILDTVRRNSVLVSHGSLSVNRDCDTIPQLSNYSTKYFLHFWDDKCKTIHDTLKEHTQFSQKKYSVTFTCKKIFLPQPNTKSLLLCNIQCLQIWHARWYILFHGPAETIREQCFSKHFLQVQKCLAHQ